MVYQPDVQDKVEQVSWGSFLPALITLGSAQGLSAREHHGQFLISPASRAPPALSDTGTRLPWQVLGGRRSGTREAAGNGKAQNKGIPNNASLGELLDNGNASRRI